MSKFTNVCFTSFKDDAPLWNPDECQYLVYQREACPETGRKHYQGYAEFKRDRRIGGIQRILGIGASHVERRGGTGKEAITYCTKEDTRIEAPVEHGTPKPEEPSSGTAADIRARTEDAYRAAHRITDYTEAMDYLRETIPLDYNRFYGSISGAFAYKRRTRPNIRALEFAFRLPSGITDWLKEEYTKTERAKCLILVGPSRLGKTAWARSVGKHIFWRGQTSMSDWDDDARYIVFDDIEWKYIPNKKSLLTQMGDCTVTDKYVRKMSIYNNKPAIVCCNAAPLHDTIEDAQYWQANSTIVYIERELFDREQSNVHVNSQGL